MIDAVGSLPQGLLWYPVVLVLAGLLIAVVVSLRQSKVRSQRRTPGVDSPLATTLMRVERSRSDDYAQLELERYVIGLLLQANGYRGYTVELCRHYATHGAPAELSEVLLEHLGDRPHFERSADGILPPRCELIVRALEEQTKEQP
jgi:hypothetical protein